VQECPSACESRIGRLPIRRRASLLIAKSKSRNTRDYDRDRKEPVAACSGPSAEPNAAKTLDHPLDRTQEKASDEEGDNAERHLKRKPNQQARFKGRLKRIALGPENTL
jgi:hypothetical protein